MMASGSPHHHPTNVSELQLYRVLERANLLGYYDSFIQQGGDDVQQLCEAGEEEFLEIMAVVGMAAKPLHVRRLQKALQGWVANPTIFQQPLTSPPQSVAPSVPSVQTSITGLPKWTPSAASFQGFSPVVHTPGSGSGGGSLSKASSQEIQICSAEHTTVGSSYILDADSIANIQEAAQIILKRYELPEDMTKKIPKEVQHIFDMPFEDPNRMTEIRKYAAIYGRFDSKRKADKQLTQHEVSVNEAAAQICVVEPLLLAQRDKLFPLARQVVRESGYKFKHGHSRAGMSKPPAPNEESPAPKKPKTEIINPYRDINVAPNPRTVQAELMKIKRQERMNEIQEALKVIKYQQEAIKDKIEEARTKDNLQRVYDLQIELEKLTTQQLVLMTEQTDLIKRQRRSDRYYVAKARLSAENDNGFLDRDRDDGGGSSIDENQDNADSNLDQSPQPSSTASSPRHEPTTEISQQPDRENNLPNVPDLPTFPRPPKKNLPPTQKILMQHTLFDEGLRLVQQHALAFGDEYQELQQRGGAKGTVKVKQEPGEVDDDASDEGDDEQSDGEIHTETTASKRAQNTSNTEYQDREHSGDEINTESAADKAAQNTINAILKLRSKTSPEPNPVKEQAQVRY
ncbi:uncharacterized protein LOC144447369 isoform X2 [Glandiceps talaboti]